MRQMLSSSHGSVGFRVIGGWLTCITNKRTNRGLTSRIAPQPAKLGPISVKYLQNLSAISSDLLSFYLNSNNEGKGALPLRLFISSLSNFQLVLINKW